MTDTQIIMVVAAYTVPVVLCLYLFYFLKGLGVKVLGDKYTVSDPDPVAAILILFWPIVLIVMIVYYSALALNYLFGPIENGRRVKKYLRERKAAKGLAKAEVIR